MPLLGFRVHVLGDATDDFDGVDRIIVYVFRNCCLVAREVQDIQFKQSQCLLPVVSIGR